ncbi:hypothetical protein M427DRAFT_159819 [Gonapodya prolifera JEL478]|uniref:Uncharacterized protein n=1 Tax=Gonapodya prolifera (strain JEL478) TaxID=1344416 RepID=A0A139A005_GONPJ|nr:hypothetical protein M427DRAFT_159819 [Gonapodya prolifera JEL478]|eukprot:KXS10062.1 hypothetical protein M427DRAFT_159819 [Gonapodya prolifera JEL478]
MTISAFFLPSSASNGTSPSPGSGGDGSGQYALDYYNVAIAASMLASDAVVSLMLGLQLERTIVVSAIRCIIQLTIMGYILTPVFEHAESFELVFLISMILMTLAVVEIVYNKAKFTFTGEVVIVFVSLFVSVGLVSALGVGFAMNARPFYEARRFIPAYGMLLGNSMTGVAVSITTCLTQFMDRRDRIEYMLALGASRWEVARPVIAEAVRVGLLPGLMSMSIIGLISIPGMMSGQILAGAPVLEAVNYQIIIIYLISSSVALASVLATVACVATCIDGTHRLRIDRIQKRGKGNPLIAIGGDFWGMLKDSFIWSWRKLRGGEVRLS